MKTILITGTSSGIGKETAALFAKKGWKVAATVRNTEHLTLFADIKNIVTYVLDVKNIDSVKSCIKQVIQDFGKIDAIVNNAGIYTTNPLELTSDKAIEDIVETNIKGVLHTTKTILEHFRENKSGVIVNVSSIAGRVTFPFQSIYHTSKWAIEGFSESLYYELKSLNIKVKVIEPGMVKTNIYDSVLDFPFEQYPDEYQTNFKKWHSYLMKNLKNGYLPELDAQTIYKAVNSNSSRLRYTTDFTTKTVFFLRSLLPLSVFQKIIHKQS
ncbi:MAG: SDR family oxidoreductase [Dysgonamonadaceae bacterium]|jgi:NADP-dependent 3-hydroxy acid dehydrogenase YdfG|nr:SDR family oxidoreductase [Dysgonamonadaceae bacterium]